MPRILSGSTFIRRRGVCSPLENLVLSLCLCVASIISSESFSLQVFVAGFSSLNDSGSSKGTPFVLNHHLISSCLPLKSISFAKVFFQSAISHDSISGAANPICFAIFSVPGILSIASKKSSFRIFGSWQSRSSITNIKSDNPFIREIASSDLICSAKLFPVLPSVDRV